MVTVLYITANPLDREQSYGMAVGEEFVRAYRDAHPYDEVVHLDLYKIHVPQLDADVLRGWNKLKAGAPFADLDDAEQRKVGRLGELADQFAAADKYVFVSPIWNYSYPPVMKAYIDAVCASGKTFKSVPGTGYVGLLGDKKAIHIQASGSALSPGSAGADFEMGHRHLSVIMKFLGVPVFDSIFVEGTAEAPDKAPLIKENAIRRAREAARTF